MNILIKFLKLMFLAFSKLKKLDVLSKSETRTIALLLSFALTFWELSVSKISFLDLRVSLVLFISFFIVLNPFLYYFRFKLLNIFSEHIFMALALIIYFIALVPILGEFHKNFFPGNLDNFVIKFLHILTLIVSILTILVVITRQFILIIFNKRKIEGIDILMTFSTYLIVGFAFGTLYYLLNLHATENLFSGVEKPSIFIFENYLNHIYISLGALSTVASGSITAADPYIRILSVMETILGVFLTSFSLGFVFAIVGSNVAARNSELKSENFDFLSFMKNRIEKWKKEVEKKEQNRKE